MNDATLYLLLAVIALAVSVVWGGIRLERLRRDVALLELQVAGAGSAEPAPMAVCRGCGGDELVIIMAGCTWVEVNLCSSCADDEECDERAAGERS